MWRYCHRHNLRIFALNGCMCYVDGGKKRKICIVENIIGQGITCKYSPIKQVKSFTSLKSLSGSFHDITAVRSTGLFGYTQPRHHAADKGYVG